MTLESFYETVGGNMNEALGRMLTEDRILKYLGKFTEKDVIESLGRKLEDKDYEGAFSDIHDLKGMCLNLSLDILAKSASELTEALRYGPKGDINALYANVKVDYEMTMKAITELLG